MERQSIYLPFDADFNDPEWWNETPFNIEEKVYRIRRIWKPFLLIRKAWCWLFGHRIRTYYGGYCYKAMKGNVYGGRKGHEKRPIRYYKHVHLKEGYCRCCGKAFSASYVKKNNLR